MKQSLLTLCILLHFIHVRADDFPFETGMELSFDIRYKYGLVMLKAGTSNFVSEKSQHNNNLSYHSTLHFKTNSFFDKIFKMRDTMQSHISENLYPMQHLRIINEGNYNFKEEIFFYKFDSKLTEARVKRTSKQVVRFDTTIIANAACYDLLNLILVICSKDYSQSNPGHSETVLVFKGKEKVPVAIRYEGQSVIEKSNIHKLKTHRISLDFSDENFNESKSAIEVWLSDDGNRIPVKIRAKLRIGAVEVHLASWKNLKYPLGSEVIIPPRQKKE